MKKILSLVLALMMILTCAVAFASCGETDTPAVTPDDTPAKNSVVKIGVYEPLTGANGAGGKQEALGMQYANSVMPTVEIGGVTYDIELVSADNESSTDKAVSAATKLVAENVAVVLGSYGSSVSIAAADTFANANIPAIGVTCTNPQVTDGNPGYFRVCFLDPFQGTVLANFAKDQLGAATVYCLGELGNDYDQGLINYFKLAAEALGMQVITAEFPTDNADFTSYLTNAKNANADVIFAPCSLQYAQLIIEQSAAQGSTAKLLAGDTWDSNVVLNAAKDKDVSIYVTTFYAEGGNVEFETGIKEWINADATRLANNGGDDMLSAVTVMGYDAYMTAVEAIKAAGSVKAADIMTVLGDVTYTGVSGAIAFDEIGDAIRDAAYVKTANTATGVWDFVTVQGVSNEK